MANIDDELDKILGNLAWNGKYTDSGQEVADAGAVHEAKAAIKQLFLEIIGEDETEYSYNHVGTYDRNKLRHQLRQTIGGDK